MNFKDGANNPYSILGLPLGADIDLVKAIYRSMVKIYHPDIFVGDKTFAAERLTELNAAFEFLSDPKQKQAYDNATYSADNNNENEHFNDETSSFDDEISSLRESWEFACEFHPEIQQIYDQLLKLNKRPAFTFMAILVEQKLYAEAKKIAQYLEDEFLLSAFGNDKSVREVGKAALLANELEYALELNRTLKRLGYSSAEQILTKLSLKYPRFGYDVLNERHKYRRLIPDNHPRKTSKSSPNTTDTYKRSNKTFDQAKAVLKVVVVFLAFYVVTAIAFGVFTLLFSIQDIGFLSISILPVSIILTYFFIKKVRYKFVLERWKKESWTQRRFLLPILITPNLLPVFSANGWYIYFDVVTVMCTVVTLAVVYYFRLSKFALYLPVLCSVLNVILYNLFLGEAFYWSSATLLKLPSLLFSFNAIISIVRYF